MSVVVDASVAMKWVLAEDGSDLAKDLIRDEILIAPDLLFVECANVLQTHRRRGLLSANAAREGYGVLEAVPMRVVPIRQHTPAALFLAAELNRSAYDALYLAVALAERAVLVTADMTFAAAVHAHPIYASALRALA